MQAYLADKYMSGPKADAILARAAPKKLKKKRKADLSHSTATDSAMVVDDDGGWGNARASDRDIQDVAAEDLSEAVVASDRGFKKRRTEESGWSTIRSGMREESPPPAADEQPVIVQDQKITKGGLVTSAALKASIAAATANIPQRSELELAEEAAAQETVYRDTSGRKIDTKAARVDAARKKREREEKEAQKMEWGKGLVQREEQAKLKRELELLRTQAFSRRADDKDLNENLKAQERWNDPAAKFLSVHTPLLYPWHCLGLTTCLADYKGKRA